MDAHNPYTDVQLLNIGLQILKDSGEFTEGLKAWFETPTRQQIWQNFKDHLPLEIFFGRSLSQET